MNKTVIFLGTGATKADGAPLQNELFKSHIHMPTCSQRSKAVVMQ